MFFSLFLSVCFVYLYSLIFYLSADTPLASSSMSELLDLFGFIILISSIIAIIGGLLTASLNKLFTSQKIINNKLLDKILTIIILSFGFLLLIENWSYTVLNVGLKTSDTVLLKVIFLSLSLFMAYQFYGVINFLRTLMDKKKVPIYFMILLISFFVFGPIVINMYENKSNAINSEQANNDYNVIIISSDGINAKEMSVYGSKDDTTPFLKSKKSEFMIFENAYTNNGNTTGSILSMLNGISPLTTKVVYPPDILKGKFISRSLPNILGELGYYRVLLAVPHFADSDSQNLAGAFDINNTHKVSYFDKFFYSFGLNGINLWFFTKVSKDLYGLLADVFLIEELDNPFAQVKNTPDNNHNKSIKLNDKIRLNDTLKNIDKAITDNNPLFSLTHFMGTHGPKFHPKEKLFSKGIKQDKAWMIEYYQDAILDFDKKIKKIYTKLESTGILNKTILIITSDHGQGWTRKFTIPLLIRLPEMKKNGNYLVNTQLIDIVPTILDVLGISAPDWMDGDSLLYQEVIKDDRYILMTGSYTNRHDDIKGWVRKNTNSENFISSNRYSVVHCNYYLNSLYPLNFTASKLSNQLPVGHLCKDKALEKIIQDATEIIEKKLL